MVRYFAFYFAIKYKVRKREREKKKNPNERRNKKANIHLVPFFIGIEEHIKKKKKHDQIFLSSGEYINNNK